MKIERPVFRYHGGKWRIAPGIISHFPSHRVYVEPFGGGASVLLRKPRSYAEVYNDLDGDVVNVFRILRDRSQSAELERLLRLTPFARDEFDLSYEPTVDSLERARRMIVRSRMGFGSDALNRRKRTGFRNNSTRSGSTPARDFMSFPDCLPSFAERLAGVVIENRDWRDVLRQHDSPDTLFYVDPPYVHSTRTERRGEYLHELTNDEHGELAAALKALSGSVVLSGYQSDLYDSLYRDWTVVRKETHADGASPRIECLWIWKALPEVAQHAIEERRRAYDGEGDLGERRRP